MLSEKVFMTKRDSAEKSVLLLTSFFDVDDIAVYNESFSQQEVFRLLLARIADRYHLADREGLLTAVREREAVCSTVITDGLALPHARVQTIDRPYVSVGLFRNGVSFPTDDGETPVYLVFLVLVPYSQPTLYLQILRMLSNLFRDSKVIVDYLAGLSAPADLMRFFESDGMILPKYVCAADMMETRFITLKDSDNLRIAINSFVSQNVDELPVTDKEGNMVGVVSIGALLKVCLPEPPTETPDVSLIMNFEPFAVVLQNEHSTWLKDILNREFASVQADAPAILVGSELIRKNTSRCYVLKDKKLSGIISSPKFMGKVFRD